MLRFAAAATLLVATTLHQATATTVINEHPNDPVQAATELLHRVLPGAASQFELELLTQPVGAPAAMQLDSKDGKVVLRGTGGVELASALNWYLNEYLNATYDWNTYADGQVPALTEGGAGQVLPEGGSSQLPLPIPESPSPVKPRQVPWSYYMNVCTYGYSLAFVPWDYWVKHIDWMALNGINMPLAFVGQEYIWNQVFKGYGLSLEDQTDFYSGPAFLPWFRMGNMKGFGGPLTEDWMEKRRDLNIKMLARMRGLGMTPALSAFAGHVPANFTKYVPTANVSRSPNWANFNLGGNTNLFSDVFLVEPTDPLFVEIGNKFITMQEKVYGTDHIYQCDTYNEMVPPTDDPAYLAASSKNVYSAMSKADPQAIWLMQGWLFQNAAFWKKAQISAYLGGVGPAKMWLLDLFGDSNPIWVKTASFHGHPYFFCTLLNFGGQQGITGNMPRVLAGVQASLANSTISGVGITMEGIWTNYPMFEVTLQQAWKATPTVPPTPCTWGTEVKGAYLAGLVPSAGGGWPYDNTKLTAAQAWCCTHEDCGGVTLQTGIYQVRASANPVHDGIATASWARTNFVPGQGGAGLNEWFTKYGTRRYGTTDPNAVAAWQLLGSTIYAGQGGGGFGSAVSSVPVLASPPGPPGPAPPQPKTPVAPKGYTRSHPQDGYWNPPPQTVPNTSVEECAELCTKLKPAGFPGIKCEAFEVYLTDSTQGNCYTFTTTNMKGSFTVMTGYPLGSRTYLRNDGASSSNTSNASNASSGGAVVTALVPPMMSVQDKAAAANLGECYDRAEVPRSEAQIFQQTWSLLLKASGKLSPVASYRFDLIDVGRQVIAGNFSAVYGQYRAAFLASDANGCAALEKQLLQTLDDYDALLSTDTNFMLGRWQSWALSWGDDDKTKVNLEYNARNQLTLVSIVRSYVHACMPFIQFGPLI
jgi:hypothetical protein